MSEKLRKARVALLLEHPWFGSLAMRLEFQADAEQPTMATDGTRLFYNPAFVDKQTDPHLVAIMAHEVMHCALLHPYRRGARDPKTWNQATDYAINAELKKAGFTLPPDVLYHPGFAGLSADAIYARLKDGENPQAGKGQGQGGDKPLSTGEVKDAPPQPGEGEGQAEGDGQDGDGEGKTAKAKPRDMTPEDWKIAAELAEEEDA